MRIIFSRKGFDSASGGAPSPVVDGRPVSLPIPAGGPSRTTYADLGLGALVEHATRGRVRPDAPCHHDPMFVNGECWFGQCGAAQTHLANRGVGRGDVFLFFGLFREEASGEPHHRLFGWLEVEEVVPLADCAPARLAPFVAAGHPHALGMHAANDTIYRGPGGVARRALPALRLTVPEGPPSLWAIPDWLRQTGLSYHDRPERWLRNSRLKSVARGQEFVADIGRRQRPRAWLARVLALMRDG